MDFTLRNNLCDCPDGCVFVDFIISKYRDEIFRTTEILIDCKKASECPQKKIDSIEVEFEVVE